MHSQELIKQSQYQVEKLNTQLKPHGCVKDGESLQKAKIPKKTKTIQTSKKLEKSIDDIIMTESKDTVSEQSEGHSRLPQQANEQVSKIKIAFEKQGIDRALALKEVGQSAKKCHKNSRNEAKVKRCRE